MASSSGRRSGSSGASKPRRRIVIDAERTNKVEYRGVKQSGSTKGRRNAGPSRASSSRDKEPSGTARQAKRISSAKREERERRQRSIRLKRTTVAIGLTTIAVAVGWGAVSLTRMPVFAVTTVRVEGVSHLDADAVSRLAGIRSGSSIVWLPKRAIAERLVSEPWVKDVSIDRDMPHTVIIRVGERTPALVVDAGGADLWTVSTDGLWLGKRTSETSLPVVRDVKDPAPARGGRVTNREVQNAVRIAQGLSPELLRTTRFISAPTVEKTALVTTDDVEVFIGSSEDIARKDRIVREILKKEKDRVLYINVRVVESPTWRGLE